MEQQNPYQSSFSQSPDSAAIRDWLLTAIARVLECTPEQLDASLPFRSMGLESVEAIGLVGELEEWLGRDLSPTLLYDYPDIATLARYLAGEAEASESPPLSGQALAEDELIAVIGIGCRFPPDANTPEAFWQFLRHGGDAVSEIPSERWEVERYYHADPMAAGKMYTRHGAFLRGVSLFDPQFFGISPREAIRMDPQHRLLMEVCWEALEHAGLVPAALAGSSTGVFIGMMNNFEYSQLQTKFSGETCTDDPYYGIGSAPSAAAGRLAYFFDFHGPTLTIDTACSSSLVALHLACQSLRRGECSLALVGGSNTILQPETLVNACKMSMLAADGQCKTFDARADGFVLGEGCGVVVLKRLSEALIERNPILCVIRGSAVNQDGRSNGLTAPNRLAQEAVIRQALTQAGLKPGQIDYVEAHGSGTALGDPIEVAALTNVLGEGHSHEHPLILGTVKTNIGHLAGAAGIAGLVKTILALQHKEIPPNLHLETPNPHIPWKDIPVRVPTCALLWPATSQPRRAGVSSFGWSGTNAHVILEEAAATMASTDPARSRQLFVFSARTEQVLDQATVRLAAYFKGLDSAGKPEKNVLADLAYTAQVGRQAFAHRRAFVCENLAEAIQILEEHDESRLMTGIDGEARRQVAFLFAGLGEQYPGMAAELYEHEEIFRQVVDQCCLFLQPLLGRDLHSYLFPSDRQSSFDAVLPETKLRLPGQKQNDPSHTLQQTSLAQPMAFITEYALARLLMHWGILPQVMLGYSLGEYVAACLAGVLSLEDTLALVAQRALMIQEIPAGVMLAVALSEEEVQPYLSEEVQLAAINTPHTCVLAGPEEAIAPLEMLFQSQGIAARRIRTQHAFHSRMLEPLATRLTKFACSLSLHPPQIPYVSNVSGTWITHKQALDPAYWAEHMCQTARFADGVQQLLASQECFVLELGPGQTLSSFVKQHPACTRERAKLIYSTLPSASEQCSAYTTLLSTVGKLWLNGCNIDWPTFSHAEQRQFVPLPAYPFEHRHYWFDTRSTPTQQSSRKRPRIEEWFYQPSWEEAPLASQDSRGIPRPSETWLLLLDDTGLGERLAQRLESAGNAAVCVQIGSQFARLESGRFTLRPGEVKDYQALLQALQKSGQVPTKIAHLWNVTGPTDLTTGPEHFQERQRRGFYSLLYLAQTFGSLFSENPIQLLVVADHSQMVNSQESIEPEKAALFSTCMVISQEYQDLICRGIDILPPEPGSNEEEHLLASLLSECKQPMTAGPLAYRDGRRWKRVYTPFPLAAIPKEAAVFRHRGVYLITGGLGGIGLLLARHLAARVQARLVLVGRTALPARDAWAGWLTEHDPENRISIRIQQLQSLEALGAEVLVCSADVAEPAEIQRVLQETRARFGTLHGVFHAAGTTAETAFRPIQRIAPGDCEPHFRPKVLGLFALEQALKEYELDFCLIFSSIASLLGGLGFAAYSAANAFIDAFVQRHSQSTSSPWISVNWDGWHLASEQAQSRLRANTLAEYAMEPEEGLEAVERVLGQKASTCLVNSTGDLQTRLNQWSIQTKPERRSEIPLLPATARTVLGSSDYERQIMEIWKQELGLETIGLHDNFFDLGGNSLIGLQVIARLKKTFRVQIPAVALFESPTVSALARYLQPQTAEQLATPAQQLVQRRIRVRQSQQQEAIAIIGMAGRFPGANSVEEFWQNLCDGVESITFFTEEQMLEAGVDPALLANPKYVKARPILADVEHFDAAFFGYSPREAELLDPQHRLFLECCWEALERAGYDPETYEGLIGVFGGANISTYMHALLAQPELLHTVDDYQKVISADKDSLTTSVSYRLNLRGPSFAVQTFCSTSLVATHLACQSLLNGESDLALAGGVSVRVPTIAGYLYHEGGMESPDGHCRTFDAQARGSLFGDGAGAVVLKRLSEAIEDGDLIYAVIKGSAINNDGSTKVSYTAPSVSGQAEVVHTALVHAGVDASSISYIEAHGTATELGDPIEVASLTRAFRLQTDQTDFCGLGSVKTNIGHLDRAAGVAGLIKVALALYHQQIPPSLHFQTANPEIDFEQSPFHVITRLTSWPRGEKPRRAGINSLGMGGTNAHAVLEEAPEPTPSGPSRPWQLLLLSARTPTALDAATSNLRSHLQKHPEIPLPDVAFTLQVGRKTFEQRRFLVCRDRDEAIDLLDQKRAISSSQARSDRPVLFLFPGVGEQFAGLTREIYEQEVSFREEVDRCCDLLEPLLGLDLRSILYPAKEPTRPEKGQANGHRQAGSRDLRALLGRNSSSPEHRVADSNDTAASSRLHQTELAQPAVFVIEYALARLLMRWGLQPSGMLGYSLGEYVAACLAGVLSLEEALHLVAFRAQQIQALPAGGMLAVQLSEQDCQPYLDDEVQLAIINAPHTCVLAGSSEGIARIERQMDKDGVACRRVATTHAFHSSMLAPAQAALTSKAEEMYLRPPHVPYISNVTGDWITPEQATRPDYWAEHMCQTVRFADGVRRLLAEQEAVLIEIGPGQSLTSFARQHPACTPERFARILPTLPLPYEAQGEQEYLLTALGKLWLVGAPISWQAFWQGEQRRRVILPTYPFERQRFWLASHQRQETMRSEPAVSATVLENISALERKAEITDWFYQPSWKQAPALDPPDLEDLATCRRLWIFFSDDCGIGEQVVKRLKSCGQEVISVTPGINFACTGPQRYQLHPSKQEQYTALLRTLDLQRPASIFLVHLWTVTPEIPSGNDVQVASEMLERGFSSLVALAQALGNAGLQACQLTVISNQVQDVLEEQILCPAKATILGPCKVISQEYTGIHCRHLDLRVPEAGSRQGEELVEQILAELLSSSGENRVALRGSRRWVPAFEPLHLVASRKPPRHLRRGGVYLITGGLGGIGLALAEHLAVTYQAKLALVSRNGLPPRHEWEHFLACHEESDPQVRRIRQVRALEEQGSEVLVLTANVTDEQAMRNAIARTLETFGALHGVLHAAGLPGFGLLQFKTPEMSAQVLAPKVQGTLVLERVLEKIHLDFLVLFSSITAITGGPGQADYCAANAFLDSYAHCHAHEQRLTLSINWSEWQWNAWEEGLSGFGSQAQTFFRESRSRFGIHFEEGMQALERLLDRNLVHVVVSTQDFQQLASLSDSFTIASITKQEQQGQAGRVAHPRPVLGTSYLPPRNDLERKVAAIWEELLGLEQIGVNDNFFELGGNSLMGIDLMEHVRHALHLDSLPVYVLYEAPSVGAMAQYIEQGSNTNEIAASHGRGEKRRENLRQRMRVPEHTR